MSYPTKYSILKSWGCRPNFQYSHGLEMTPDDIDEGNVIIDHFLQDAREDWESRQQQSTRAYDQRYEEGQRAVRTESNDYDRKQDQYHYEERPSTSGNYDPMPSYGEAAGRYYDSSASSHKDAADGAHYYDSAREAQYYEEPASSAQYYQEPARDDQGYENEPATVGHDSEAFYDGAYYEPPSETYGDASYEYSGGGDHDAGGDATDYSDSYDDGGYASAGSYGDYDDDDYDDDYD